MEQDSPLLKGTVTDNLRLARPDAGADELYEATKAAVLAGHVDLTSEIGPACCCSTSRHQPGPRAGNQRAALAVRREIARQLSVPVNTGRTHMRHVYEKLGAHRRAGAVERARPWACSRLPRAAPEGRDVR
jgi:Bacterial regulatory proteins, luxR family